MLPPRTLWTALVRLLCSLTPAAAHDYWLEPDSFFPSPGARVAVHLPLGERLQSEKERPFQKKPTVRFELLWAGPKGIQTQDLSALGQEDKTPVARVSGKSGGNYLIALERQPQTIKLSAD